jgi:pimeloyl-ACP methyl ester carboxylesterase
MTSLVGRRAEVGRTVGAERPGWPGLAHALLVGLLCAAPIAAHAQMIHEETIHIQGPLKGLKLGLRHAWTLETADRPVVLILHGAAVPVSSNPDYPFTGRSVMTALAQSGLDVWALDYYGFGESDRYPEMAQPANAHPPLGTAEECADQVDAVFAYLQRQRHGGQIMLLGDSGGTLVAGAFATRRPQAVSRLVLFGPVTPFTGGPSSNADIPAYSLITPTDLWTMFSRWSEAAGDSGVLDSSAFQAWADTYLRSDPTSGTRTPPSVKYPNGRQADLAAIARGKFTYDPSMIRAPTLIVMGEWDEIATFAGAEWLLKSLRQAPQRRLVVIGHASHTVQYEKERNQLYRVVADFFNERE